MILAAPVTERNLEPIRLGSIEIKNRVLAAPLCGASKIPFRELARRYGADIAYTEMVKAYPLVRGRNDRRTLELLQTEAADAPCGPQICGAEEDIMADAARRLEQLGFPLVDINMGCPVPKVVREGAGSALLKDPSKVERDGSLAGREDYLGDVEAVGSLVRERMAGALLLDAAATFEVR